MGKFSVTFEFDSAETRHGFLVWFLDAAGDQNYWQAAEYWKESAPRRGTTCWPIAYFTGWPPSSEWSMLPEILIQAPDTIDED